MDQLTRLQVLTEIVSEFKTALLKDQEADQIGMLVVDIAYESDDGILYDLLLNAYLKRANEETAIQALDEATHHLHGKIDELL